ncbi:Gfo/Idh/MocA family protein [Algirhabdus cladophorae]|uniref:Gfo/Idh/MocA family protein n=1 Tax=Algirhabdus cladophorae TaxID=3377108 RepID=UPI003B849C91
MDLRVACFGAGYFAGFHYDAWQRAKGAALVGGIDLDPARVVAYGTQAFDSLDALVTSQKIDVLDIITPPPTHAATVRKAIALGVKAIICQKPFCTSLEEAQSLTAEAETAGIPLIIHENFRFQPWFRTIKAAMDSGQIGVPLQTTFRLRTGDGQGPEAYMDRQPYFQTMPRLLIHETGVHYLDTFLYLMGEPVGIYADLRRVNPVIAGEDAGYVLFDYANGARAIFDGNRCLDFDTDNPRRTFGEALIEGSEGTLTLAGDGTVTLRKFGTQQSKTLLSGRDWPGFAGDCVLALCQHVADGLAGHATLENTARDYLRVVKLAEAAYASDAAQARLPVDL